MWRTSAASFASHCLIQVVLPPLNRVYQRLIRAGNGLECGLLPALVGVMCQRQLLEGFAHVRSGRIKTDAEECVIPHRVAETRLVLVLLGPHLDDVF